MISDQGTAIVHYIAIDGQLKVIIDTQGSTHTPHYVYTDHLGSIIKVTNAAGTDEVVQTFDPWGRRRDYSTWTYIDENLPLGHPIWLYRGYTGHEHLPQFQLINMNGRMYDPEVGRMLSPHNYIQDGGYSQNYNRCSYALNNPLKFTDPDGNVIVPLLISIGVGLLTNGLSNTANDKPFSQGAMRTIGFAIATFGVSVQLQSLAFDYIYDKSLYDDMVWRNHAWAQRRLLESPLDHMARSVHFIENPTNTGWLKNFLVRRIAPLPRRYLRCPG